MRGGPLAALSEYQRYAAAEDGVSPLAIPGASRHLVVADSDEHDHDGHIIEDARTRVEMVEKRLFRKLARLRQEIEPPILVGSDQPELVLVGYGSTYGVLREAVASLSSSHRVAMLHFSQVFPFPSAETFDYLEQLRKAGRVICVENNATGQFARLLRAETSFEVQRRINTFDGRPFTIEGLLGEINAHLG